MTGTREETITPTRERATLLHLTWGSSITLQVLTQVGKCVGTSDNVSVSRQSHDSPRNRTYHWLQPWVECARANAERGVVARHESSGILVHLQAVPRLQRR